MINEKIRTAEFVTPKHPDKMCDFIADSLLDVYLSCDSLSRVAIEVMGGHKRIVVNGEVTSTAFNEIDGVEIIKKIVGNKYDVFFEVENQSLEIARGVDFGGAGDQGIMTGYACNETENFMPKEYELARNLCKQLYEKFPFDGKVQVTISENKIYEVVVSFQNTKTNELKKLTKSLISSKNYHINPAGEWHQGGFDADTGLSGRKIVIDNYGPNISIGGGSFSGKDVTKVDRSGAYMSRKIAVDILKEKNAKEVFVKLAYAIGEKNPVMAIVNIDGKEENIKNYNLTPRGIKELLSLNNVKYSDTSKWGHFGRDFRWDI